MLSLEAERGNGRDDYPVRPMWNSLIAAFVFQHASIAALRRDVNRMLILSSRPAHRGARAIGSTIRFVWIFD